jgi:cell division transport system ATP-binding protein
MMTFSQVTKSFGDGTVALSDVSFHIEPGELVVITGPSGSGKTTLMRLLIHDYAPTEGVISYKGEPLESITAGQIPYHRRKIGVVFQDYRLLPELNVWENIALPLSILGKAEGEIESRVTDLLSLVRLIDRALVFPKQLSGGEAQRVSIARALATGPSVIFADEPIGNLDRNSSLGIVKLLQQINSLGTTILIATHDVTLLDVLENERQLILEKGKLIKDTRPGKASEKPVETKTEPEEKPAEKKETRPGREKPVKPKISKKIAKSEQKKQPKQALSTETAKNNEEKPLSAEFEEVKHPPQKKKSSLFGSISKKLPSLKLPSFGRNKTMSEKPTVDQPGDRVTDQAEHHE